MREVLDYTGSHRGTASGSLKEKPRYCLSFLSLDLNPLAGRGWDCVKVLVLTEEQSWGSKVTQNPSGSFYWVEPHEIAISISPRTSNIGNVIWFNITFIEPSHPVCLSECRVHSMAEGALRPPVWEGWHNSGHPRAKVTWGWEGKESPQKHWLGLNFGFEPGLQSWLQQNRYLAFPAHLPHL